LLNAFAILHHQNVVNIVKPDIPLSAYANHAYFKLNMCDFGILRRFNPERSVLTSMDHGKKDILPLYAFWKLRDWLRESMDPY